MYNFSLCGSWDGNMQATRKLGCAANSFSILSTSWWLAFESNECTACPVGKDGETCSNRGACDDGLATDLARRNAPQEQSLAEQQRRGSKGREAHGGEGAARRWRRG